VVANQVAEVVEQWEYDRVPLGTMLPYFGASKDPPNGYVWADGTTNWPDEPWVPEHLRWHDDPSIAVERRGKPMPVPNMEDYLLAGGNPNEVGTKWDTGKVSVEGTIAGENFTLPEITEEDAGTFLSPTPGPPDDPAANANTAFRYSSISVPEAQSLQKEYT
jgi:hypothetical protein